MDKNNGYKIALVLYTQGLDYDDRIRKQMVSIRKLFPTISFKVFAVEPFNREEEGITSYGIPYRIPYLKTREKYPSGSHTLVKALDFYRTVKKDLKGFDALWCADIETFPFVLLTRGMPILWDHHELPERFINKAYLRRLYKFMERRCKVVLHANQPRLDYMKRKGLVSDLGKHYVLRNYPEFNEIDPEYDETFRRFEKWLGQSKCVYLQGLLGRNRADVESIGAVLSIPDLKAVVVGRISEAQMRIFEREFGQELSERVFFTGQQKQLKTPQYIRRCIMSLVFYKNTNLNNWYCEPNRLFQNLNNGNPVVVGNNPPLKAVIDNFRVGVCANTDGSEQGKIEMAIRELLASIGLFKENLLANKDQWLWGSQEPIIIQIIERLLRA